MDNRPTNSSGAYAIGVDSAGNVYVTGGSDGRDTYRDYATVKYSPQTPAPTPTSTNTPTPIPITIFYLHGSGGAVSPPTLFLDALTPSNTTAKYKDSASIKFNSGTLWKEVGTWPAAPALSTGSVIASSSLHAWIGLKSSDDQGTNFDLRVEVYQNGVLVASGETH